MDKKVITKQHGCIHVIPHSDFESTLRDTILQSLDSFHRYTCEKCGLIFKTRAAGEGLYGDLKVEDHPAYKTAENNEAVAIKKRKDIIIGASDGSCKGNPGKGGWGALIYYNSNGMKIRRIVYGGKDSTTNQEMELTGLINLLQLLDKYPSHRNVLLKLDSKYVLQGMNSVNPNDFALEEINGEIFTKGWIGKWINNGWKTTDGKDVKHKELWLKIVNICADIKFKRYMTLRFKWVPSHVKDGKGDKDNEFADGLANIYHTDNLKYPKRYCSQTLIPKLSNIKILNVKIVNQQKTLIANYKTTNLLEYTKNNRPDGWRDFFDTQIDPEMGSIPTISEFLKREANAGKTIYPPMASIYTAFNSLKPEDIRVIILGQDVYHDQGQAMGLAFSVNKGVTVPPSLRNIYKELVDDGYQVSNPNNGDLSKWAKNGVFLLNTALTVEAHKPESHIKMWNKEFTTTLISWLNAKCNKIVVILWGNYAKRFESNFKRHRIITSPHPSPFSANSGFFGSKPFSRANKLLEEMGFGKELIDWSL